MLERSKDIFMHEIELKQDFKQLREKADKIQKVDPELFRTVAIDPNNVLSNEQSQHIAKHAKFLCSTEGIATKIPQCTTEPRPEEDQVFLESAISQIKRGVFNVEEVQGKLGKSKSQLQSDLIVEFII